ncbi:hypothetical protein M433DRAFT_159789, partial [Acidomyces richmondensis BFW]
IASSADILFSYVAVYVALRTRVRGCLLAEGVIAVALYKCLDSNCRSIEAVLLIVVE